MEITINYFARQYVDGKHEFIKETLSTSKENLPPQTLLPRPRSWFRVYSYNETGRRKYSSIWAKTQKNLYYKQSFAAKNRPDFLNPIWRTVDKINRTERAKILHMRSCFDNRYSFSETIPGCFSIALKVILCLFDRYKLFTSDCLRNEVCQNAVFSKIDITMTTINAVAIWPVPGQGFQNTK